MIGKGNIYINKYVFFFFFAQIKINNHAELTKCILIIMQIMKYGEL